MTFAGDLSCAGSKDGTFACCIVGEAGETEGAVVGSVGDFSAGFFI